MPAPGLPCILPHGPPRCSPGILQITPPIWAANPHRATLNVHSYRVSGCLRVRQVMGVCSTLVTLYSLFDTVTANWVPPLVYTVRNALQVILGSLCRSLCCQCQFVWISASDINEKSFGPGPPNTNIAVLLLPTTRHCPTVRHRSLTVGRRIQLSL